MNKRINELIKQCTSWSEGSTWTSHEEFDKEKFAELIVRECVDIANKQFSVASGLDDRDCWTAVEIKKHFGVGELE